MKKFIKDYYKNFILLFFGILLLGIGSTFFNQSNFGSDSIFALMQGVANTLKIQIGWGNLICNVIFFTLMLFLNRKALGIGTFFMVFLSGVTLNLFVMLGFLQPATNIYLKIVYILAGNVICAFGVALFIYANIGYSPFEAVIIAIKERIKWPLWLVKIICDGIFFLIGYLLGATIGIGSIITLIIYGPLLDLFLKLLKKTKIISEKKETKTHEAPNIS